MLCGSLLSPCLPVLGCPVSLDSHLSVIQACTAACFLGNLLPAPLQTNMLLCMLARRSSPVEQVDVVRDVPEEWRSTVAGLLEQEPIRRLTVPQAVMQLPPRLWLLWWQVCLVHLPPDVLCRSTWLSLECQGCSTEEGPDTQSTRPDLLLPFKPAKLAVIMQPCRHVRSVWCWCWCVHCNSHLMLGCPLRGRLAAHALLSSLLACLPAGQPAARAQGARHHGSCTHVPPVHTPPAEQTLNPHSGTSAHSR